MTVDENGGGHDKRYPVCGGRTRAGGLCTRPAGWGTSHAGFGSCKLHGGSTPAGVKHGERLEAEASQERARAALERLGLGQGAVVIDPAEAMLAMVHEAAYNVEVYRQAIASLDVDLGVPGERHTVALELWGKEANRIAPHTLVELYNAERDRLVKYSAECRRAGVEERRIEITAELGRQMVEILRAAVAVVFTAVRAELVAGALTRDRLDVLETEEVPVAVAAEVSRIRSERSAA